jgi:hypothetical protein
MFAENLTGWVYNSLLVLGTMMTTLLALISLYAAGCGKSRITVLLVAPALIYVLFLGWYFVQYGYQGKEFATILIVPPLGVGVFAIVYLRWRIKQ